MKKEELLNRLSNVITSYSDDHTESQDKEEEKEWTKNVRACEEVEKYFRKTYPGLKTTN